MLLGREYEPTDRNANRKTRPDDDGRNNCKREAGVEIPVPVETLQMEHFNHLENDARTKSERAAANARHTYVDVQELEHVEQACVE